MTKLLEKEKHLCEKESRMKIEISALRSTNREKDDSRLLQLRTRCRQQVADYKKQIDDLNNTVRLSHISNKELENTISNQLQQISTTTIETQGFLKEIEKKSKRVNDLEQLFIKNNTK